MKNLLLNTLGFMAALTLASCSQPPQPTESGVLVAAQGGAAEIQTVMMPNGNKCYVLIGASKGAISCSFDK